MPIRDASRPAVLALLLLCAVGATAVVRFATANGAGVSPDSIVYLTGARAIAAGRGFTTVGADGAAVPIAHFPPLYPGALALLARFGVDPLDGAGPLNALLFGAYVLLAGWLVWRATASALVALAGSVACLVSAPLLQVAAMAWSEPLFLLLGLGVIGCVARDREVPSIAVVTAAGTLAALAILTRFAGFALVPAGVLAILGGGRRRSPVAAATVYTLLAAAPPLLWTLNTRSQGAFADRSLGFHPIGVEDLRAGWRSVAAWVAPGGSDPAALALWLGVAVVVIALVATRRQAAVAPSARELVSTATTFALAYVGFVLLSRLLLDAHITFEERIACPAYAWGLVALVTAAGSATGSGSARVLRPATFALLAVVGANQAAFGAAWAMRARQSGLGFNGAAWRASPTLAAVRALPRDTRLFSNGNDIAALLTDRPVAGLPARLSPNSHAANPRYPAEIASLRRALACEDAVLVHLSGVTWRWYLPSEEELQQALPLRLIQRAEDGALYGSAETCNAAHALP